MTPNDIAKHVASLRALVAASPYGEWGSAPVRNAETPAKFIRRHVRDSQ